MDRTLTRIQAITQELNQIQAELYSRALAQDPATAHRFLDEPESLEILSSFKAAVDELRRFLWFYIDELATRKGEDADRLMHSYRMRRAAEILRVLREDSFHHGMPCDHEGEATFLEQITAVVESYIQPLAAKA